MAIWAVPNSTFCPQVSEIARISAWFSACKQWLSIFLCLLPQSVPRIGKFPEGRVVLECLLTNLQFRSSRILTQSPVCSAVLCGLQTDEILYFIQLLWSVLGEHQSVASHCIISGSGNPLSFNFTNCSSCSTSSFLILLHYFLNARVSITFHRYLKNPSYWASLVVQLLRIHLPMQETRVQALVWEYPTCRGATKPVHHNY